MDLGDIVIFDGQRFYVRGVDPIGVDPNYVYLEDVQTGEAVSVAFERERLTRKSSGDGLRLVRDECG